MKVVIAGGRGYLGQILAERLTQRGADVVVLTRDPDGSTEWRQAGWDGKTLGSWTDDLQDANVLVNLSGRSVNCRYNHRNQQEILKSRVQTTKLLGEAVAQCSTPPAVWMNSSSATIYRHAEDRAMDEYDGEIGEGFSVNVCREWERELWAATTPKTRKVALRTAMVFGPNRGGVYDAFENLAKKRLAGTMASGRQYVSWIHEKDFANAIEWMLARPEFEGAVNLAAPNPLPNAEFLNELRVSMRIRHGMPTTRLMLQFGAAILGTESELLLKSRRVVPKRLLDSGFTFDYPEWREAARAIARLR